MQKTILFLSIGLLFLACTNSANKNQPVADSSSSTTKMPVDPYLQKGTFTEADSLADLQVKGYTIKRLSGKEEYGGYTKVEYKNTLQLLNNARSKAKRTMQADDDLNSDLDMYRDFDQGGEVRLDIGRISIDAANMDNFEIIIKDTADSKELFRGGFNSRIAETPNGDDLWWNLGLKSVTTKIRPPFYVYVADKLNDSPFKFLVTVKN
ncbi:MAG TPA: hypothetical protein VG738_08205 [Chitinophagaceae bacterium]|nr:hypothetical protein [Chitinophagaceae bacterium]